jgi:hypothetical protein
MENCKYTTTQDMFLEKVGITNSFNDDNAYRHTPFFEVNGIQFAHIKKNELYYVISSLSKNLSPSLALEMLDAIINRIHDFCGGIDERLLCTNFVLIYEIIDEIIDFGFP